MHNLGARSSTKMLDMGGNVVEDCHESWVYCSELSLTSRDDIIYRLLCQSMHPITDRATHVDQEIRIRSIKHGNPNAWRQRLLSFEALVQTLAKDGLDAERLQYESAHPDDALFCRIELVF